MWIDGAYITLFILWRKNILFVKLRNASHNYRADVTHTHIEYTCAQSKVRPAPSNGQVKVQLNIVENTLGLIIFEERKHIYIYIYVCNIHSPSVDYTLYVRCAPAPLFVVIQLLYMAGRLCITLTYLKKKQIK